MIEFDGFDELPGLVDENQGIAVCEMWQLRDAAKWERLTSRALDEIENKLAQRGLGSFPKPLPESRRAEVRIYRLGTRIAEVVEAVTNPSEHRDDLLREVANRDSDAILREVRRLVST